MPIKIKIYKITGPDNNKCYIGKTTDNTIRGRWRDHRSDYTKRYTKCPASKYIFDEYGLDNCKIELVESKLCDTKDEARKLEQYYINNTNSVNIQNKYKNKPLSN